MSKHFLKTCTAMLCACAMTMSGMSYASMMPEGNLEAMSPDVLGSAQGAIGAENDTVAISNGDLVALDDLNISIVAKDYSLIRQDDEGFVYVYTMEENSIPYVIIGFYEMGVEGITDAFTRFMERQYTDLQVAQPATTVAVGNYTCYEIGYSYTVQGYKVRDTRLFTGWNGRAYMFGSKEIPEIGYTVPEGYLTSVLASFAPLAGGDSDYPKHVDSTRTASASPSDVEISWMENTAPASDVISLDDMGISIEVDEYLFIDQEDDECVYIYPSEVDNLPYVISCYYDVSIDDVVDAFTQYIGGVYPDLQVVQPASEVTLGGNACHRIVYEYTSSGYTFHDTRLFFGTQERSYMFGGREVPELGLTLPEKYLESIVASAKPLDNSTEYSQHVNSTTSANPPEGQPETPETTSDPFSTGADTTSTQAPDTTIGTIGGPVSTEPPADVDNTISFTENMATFAGVWVPFEDGFKLYLPAHWSYYVITEEQKAGGVLYIAGDASVTEHAPFMSVNYVENTFGYTTLDDLANDLESNEFTIDGKVSVNGIPCVSYTNTSTDVGGLVFFHPTSTQYVFTVACSEYSANTDIQASILCSLSPNN